MRSPRATQTLVLRNSECLVNSVTGVGCMLFDLNMFYNLQMLFWGIIFKVRRFHRKV